jgi:hypothetical protein
LLALRKLAKPVLRQNKDWPARISARLIQSELPYLDHGFRLLANENSNSDFYVIMAAGGAARFNIAFA